jgi:hypothetical protein
MKSLKNRVRSNKLNVWFILLGVGLLFVVFYYFLGKKFGLREGATSNRSKKKSKSLSKDKRGSTERDDDYDYDAIKNSLGDLVDIAYLDHKRLLDLENPDSETVQYHKY